MTVNTNNSKTRPWCLGEFFFIIFWFLIDRTPHKVGTSSREQVRVHEIRMIGVCVCVTNFPPRPSLGQSTCSRTEKSGRATVNIFIYPLSCTYIMKTVNMVPIGTRMRVSLCVWLAYMSTVIPSGHLCQGG
jgi:hypothetical protein